MSLLRFSLLLLVSLTIIACIFMPSAFAETEKSLPPESSAKKGNLSILSDPGGANVFINEVLYGKTPFHHSLPAGTYNLRLEKAGYVTMKEVVKVKEGEDTALDFELEEKQ